VFHPVLVAAVSIMATVVKNIVFPLLFFGAILAVISHISERFRVTRLAGLCKDIGIGVLGLSLTVMIGVIAVQGIAGSVADGVALRTAKYMTGAFLPVVGGVLSDAVEAVVGCSLLLKDAIGLLGALAIFVICIFPVLKIAAMMLIYKIASALIQPIGDVGLADSLQTIASYLMLVLASVASVGVMLFLMIAAVVGAGSLTVMLR
jgi:stage III sporulation protein AE